MAPHQLAPAVPPVLSELVLTLMQKRPEDRYQSARGLLADLERCRAELDRGGTVAAFALRSMDVDRRLRIPERLYGRAREVGALLGAFQRVSEGAREVLFVTGHPGIGKTRLVHQVHPAILESRGRFIQGKFDQFHRGVPYASVLTAFRGWLREVLEEPPVELAAWRERIGAAVGANGHVLAELLPELEILLGAQPPVEEVGAAEARNRLFLVMRRFVQALASPEHPLVLFLDDLQWADRPSLDLVAQLATDPDTTHMMFLGAYRDGEVDADHPLARIQAELAETQAPSRTLRLGPLPRAEVRAFVSDALGQPLEPVAALADLCLEKTGGNPFFLARFLSLLHERELLRFDGAQRRWTWNPQEITAQGVTDNVVQLLCDQLSGLPPSTRAAVLAGAVIGTCFDLETVARLRGNDPRQVQAELRPALDRDLLQVQDGIYWEAEEGPVLNVRYRFAHDRVQQAADSMLGPEERQRTHLALARLLQAQAGDAPPSSEQLFARVEHLGQAAALLDEGELRTACTLHLAAGQRAMESAAYAPAHAILERAVGLAGEVLWQADPDQAMELWLAAARSAYLASEPERMAQLLRTVRARSRSVLDRARAATLEVQALTSAGELPAAIEGALAALAELGVVLPGQPTQAEIGAGLQDILQRIGARGVAELVALPGHEDPAQQLVLQLETLCSVPAFLTRPALLPVLAFAMVRSSLERGLTRESPYGFGLLGLFLCAIDLSDVAYTHAKVALALLDRFDDCSQQARARHLAVGFVKPWNEPLRQVLPEIRAVYDLGVETGDLEYACWAAHMYCADAFWAGIAVPVVAQELDTFIGACRRFKQEPQLYLDLVFRQCVDVLLNGAEQPTRLRGAFLDEEPALAAFAQAGFRGAIAVTRVHQAFLRLVFGDFASAAAAAEEGLPYGDGVLATWIHVGLRFYGSLARLLAVDPRDAQAVAAAVQAVAAHRVVIQTWCGFCPANHAHRLALIDAEIARVQGQAAVALDLYDQAIELSRQHGFTQDRALANELAGRFHLGRGRTTVARAYLTEARFAYQQWGASAKVRALEEAFPGLTTLTSLAGSDDLTLTDPTILPGTAGLDLDVVSVAKAMTAIALEDRLDALLARIVAVAMENAGAQRAVRVLAGPGAGGGLVGWGLGRR